MLCNVVTWVAYDNTRISDNKTKSYGVIPLTVMKNV